jgi:hypothetical protein
LGAAVLGACSAATPSSQVTGTPASPLDHPSATTVLTDGAVDTPVPDQARDTDGPTALASGTPYTTDPTPTPPPDGLVSVDGGDPVVGELGSWGWLGAGSDAPWLPGRPIHVGTHERLAFVLAEPVEIAQWRVSRVPPSSVPGSAGVVGVADGTGDQIAFDAPPTGTWSVLVEVTFANDQGGAAYYWAVTVE